MSFTSWLPETPGLLPKWLLFVAAVSILNGAASLVSPSATRRVYAYATPEVTAHAARLFGTWTILSGVVRAYAAYRVANEAAYGLAWCTFVVALVHFGSETLVWKTTGPRTAAVSTYVVASVSTVWMWLSWADYVR